MSHVPSLSLLLALVACAAPVEPRPSPIDPPPNVPDGLVLAEYDTDEIARWSQGPVREALAAELASPTLEDATRARLLGRRIVTGMSRLHVLLLLEAQPWRLIDQGPPGGMTYLWEGPRLWVRFDERGRAVGAGRF